MDKLLDLIVDESKWMPFSFVVALAGSWFWWWRERKLSDGPLPLIDGLLNLFYGCLIGTMAFGHVLAVSVKAGQGTLDQSLFLMLLLGAALATPCVALLACVVRARHLGSNCPRYLLWSNVGLAIVLLALGLHNAPLAAPTLLNIVLLKRPRPWLAKVAVTLGVAAYGFLVVGSIVFLAHGGSFEDFQGM